MDSTQAPPTPSSIHISFERQTNSYSASSPSSISSSTSSVFSADAASSQGSVASSICSSSSLDVGWDADHVASISCSETYLSRHVTSSHVSTSTVGAAVADSSSSCSSPARSDKFALSTEQRLNRRRTNRAECRNACAVATPVRPPPSLTRQSDRRINFVDSLVGKPLLFVARFSRV